MQAVPTPLILDRGEVIGRRAGALPAASLRSWAEETLARHDQAASASHGQEVWSPVITRVDLQSRSALLGAVH